jgi:hypothetical protein
MIYPIENSLNYRNQIDLKNVLFYENKNLYYNNKMRNPHSQKNRRHKKKATSLHDEKKKEEKKSSFNH